VPFAIGKAQVLTLASPLVLKETQHRIARRPSLECRAIVLPTIMRIRYGVHERYGDGKESVKGFRYVLEPPKRRATVADRPAPHRGKMNKRKSIKDVSKP
jgi:hypothetical protein